MRVCVVRVVVAVILFVRVHLFVRVILLVCVHLFVHVVVAVIFLVCMILFVGVFVSVILFVRVVLLVGVLVAVVLLVCMILFVRVLVAVIVMIVVPRMHERFVVAVDERDGSSGRHEHHIGKLLRALHLLRVRLQAQPVVNEHVGRGQVAHLPRARLPVVRVGAARRQLRHLRVGAGHAPRKLIVWKERGIDGDLLAWFRLRRHRHRSHGRYHRGYRRYARDCRKPSSNHGRGLSGGLFKLIGNDDFGQEVNNQITASDYNLLRRTRGGE